MLHPQKMRLGSIFFLFFILILASNTNGKNKEKSQLPKLPEPIPLTEADWKGIQKVEIQTDSYLFVYTEGKGIDPLLEFLTSGLIKNILDIDFYKDDTLETKTNVDAASKGWFIEKVFHKKLSEIVHNQTSVPVLITPVDYLESKEKIIAVTMGYEKKWKKRMKDIVKISTDSNTMTFSISFQARLEGKSDKPNLNCWAFWSILPPGNHSWEEIREIGKSNKYFNTRIYITDCGTKKQDEWFANNGILFKQTVESAMDVMSQKICKDILLPPKQDIQKSINPIESRNK